jgi:hypothetical protein
MKNQNLAIFIIFFGTAMFFNNCKKTEVLPDGVVITLNVFNEINEPIDGAKIYLFNNEADYTTSLEKRIPLNALDSSSTANGKVDLAIDTKNTFYLLIFYKDIARKLFLSNIGYKNIISNIPKGLSASVNVILTPIDGNVVFWSNNLNAFPIKLILDKDSVTITNSRSTVPDINDLENAIFFNKNKGTYKYYAKNNVGCVWTGQIKLDNNLKSIELETCNVGNVVFYTSLANSKHNSIKVVLNKTDTLGNIGIYQEDYACGSTNDNFSRPAGKYVYTALSSDNKCFWSDTFSLKSGDCKAIKLDICK